MVFSTPVFMFVFLTLTMAVYYIVPRRARNLVLLISSLFFYFWGERVFTLIMLFSTVVDYTHGMLVEHFIAKGNRRAAKWAVASSVIVNLGLLVFFKYWDLIAEALNSAGLTFVPVLGTHLPIGISFYTFQTMSYTIDVYRGDAGAQKNIVNFGTFVTMFPQLIAGPIVKYRDIDGQLRARKVDSVRFASGVQIFVTGLAKKLLLANNIGMLWDIYKETPIPQLTTLGAWLGVTAFAFQIYFDFSGYSDMATGLGRMFGFEFLPNFNYPYVSRSITEFWRRWHISLSSWFREYLYIPLGGNRRGRAIWMRNIFIVWAATGLWHGASWNYLVWGLYFCVILMAEKLFILKRLEKLPAAVGHVYAIFLILVSWAIFGLEDFSVMKGYLGAMFGICGAGAADAGLVYNVLNFLPVLTICSLASTTLGKTLYAGLPGKSSDIVRPVLILLSLVLCSAYLVAGTYNPFLYFRF